MQFHTTEQALHQFAVGKRAAVVGLFARHPAYGLRKVFPAADVIPVRMRQQNHIDLFRADPMCSKLRGCRLLFVVDGQLAHQKRDVLEVLVDVCAETCVEEKGRLRMANERRRHAAFVSFIPTAAAIDERLFADHLAAFDER